MYAVLHNCCPSPLQCRKMPREGPEARLAPHEESAVSRVLRTAVHRPGQPIFFPYIGTTFNSCEEAWEYYNLYSWEIGFGIRYGRRSTNRKDYQTIQDLVCSCEVNKQTCTPLITGALLCHWECTKQSVIAPSIYLLIVN
jgi:hypothetical protein